MKVKLRPLATTEDFNEFLENGVIYSHKSYSVALLTATGPLKRSNIAYYKKQGLKVSKDLYGASCVNGDNLVEYLKKKSGIVS